MHQVGFPLHEMVQITLPYLFFGPCWIYCNRNKVLYN